ELADQRRRVRACFERPVRPGKDELRQELDTRRRQATAFERARRDPGVGDATVSQYGPQLAAVGRPGDTDDAQERRQHDYFSHCEPQTSRTSVSTWCFVNSLMIPLRKPIAHGRRTPAPHGGRGSVPP